MQYSLRPVMIARAPNFGEIEARRTLTLKTQNNNYFETSLKVAVSKDFLMLKTWCKNI